MAVAVEARRAADVKSAEQAEQNRAMAEQAKAAAGKLVKDAYSAAKHLATAGEAVSGMAHNVLVHRAEADAKAVGWELAYGAQANKSRAQQHLHALAQARVAKSQISQVSHSKSKSFYSTGQGFWSHPRKLHSSSLPSRPS